MFGTKPRRSPIPVEFLLQMGTCDVTIHGVKVTTHIANHVEVVDKHIADLRSYLECNTKVVGFDVKKLKHGYSTTYALVLCVSRRCLIIQCDYLGSGKVLESLDDFSNDPKICFVGVNQSPDGYNMCYLVKITNSNVGVKVGDLAARVMRNSALIESNLADIAQQVGVSYDGPTSATPEIEIDNRNPKVFTDEHVVAAVSDACAYYQIGCKLLTAF